ncbi:unnamed protein product [Closterium sp. NIES-65]|nr:unnamed protein product [Closterium sp. NIES-65]
MDAEKLIPTSRVPDDRQKLLAGSSSHASHAMDVDDSVRLPEPARRTPSSAYKSGKEACPESAITLRCVYFSPISRCNPPFSLSPLSLAVSQAFLAVLHSWATKRFMSGCAILFPIAITFYMTWWFFTFVDGFFSPIYRHVYGIDILGLGFITTISFIFFVGVFVSSWVGSSVLWIGEWIIHRMPLMKHIYSASKQISNAISPGGWVGMRNQNVNAFKEVAILRHPRIGEYAFGFITSNVTLQVPTLPLTLTLQVPTLPLTLTLQVPTLPLTLTLQVPTLPLTLTLQVPTLPLTLALTLQVPTLPLTLTLQVPTLPLTLTLQVQVPTSPLTPQVPTLSLSALVLPCFHPSAVHTFCQLPNSTLQLESGVQEELVSVYVPTNHVYIGDTFLVPESDIIRPNLSVREGLVCCSSMKELPSFMQELLCQQR